MTTLAMSRKWSQAVEWTLDSTWVAIEDVGIDLSGLHRSLEDAGIELTPAFLAVW